MPCQVREPYGEPGSDDRRRDRERRSANEDRSPLGRAAGHGVEAERRGEACSQRRESRARRLNALTPSSPASSGSSSLQRATATPERSKRARSSARRRRHSR